MTIQAFTRLGPREQIAALLDLNACEFLHSTAPRELSLALGRLKDMSVVAAAQHSAEQGGTLGQAHTDALLDLLKIVQSRRPQALLLLLDSGGVRLHEGNRGMAGLGRVLQEILSLRAGGVVCVAVVGGRVGCWGGATLIASACDSVVMVANTRYGLSGPKVLQEMARMRGQALDVDSVKPYLGPEHRLFTHEVDRVASDEVTVVRDTVAGLVETGAVDPLARSQRVLAQAGGRMAGVELATQQVSDALPATGPAPVFDDVLAELFTTFTRHTPVDGVLSGHGELDGRLISFVGCTGAVAMGPAQGLALLSAVLEAHTTRPERMLLLADAIQAFSLQNEQYGYGQILGALLESIWYVHTQCCPVVGLVRHAGSGASMVALAMGGIDLYATAVAQIHPLPPNVIAVFGADHDRAAIDATAAVENFHRLGAVRDVWRGRYVDRLRAVLTAPPVASTG